MTIRKNRGFLLVEAMLTVALVAGAVVLINYAFTSSIKAISISNDYLKAQMLMDELAFDIEVEPIGDKGIFEETLKFQQKLFRFVKTVSEIDDETFKEYADEGIGINQIILQLEWGKGTINRNLDIVSYVYAEETK